MTHQQFKMQPWHIFSGVFLVFWILMSYFDNFIITLILCVGAGFATDNLNQFMKGADDDEPPTPEKAKAKVEETLLDLKDAAQDDNNLLLN